MVLTLRMPSMNFPDYKEVSKTNISDSNASEEISRVDEVLKLRAVIDVYLAGGNDRIVRKVCNPVKNTDGSYSVSLDLNEGIYDLCLWADFVESSVATADKFYNTFDLRSVAVMSDPYLASVDGKEAMFAVMSALRHNQSGTTQNVYLQWPLARYKLVAMDLQRYSDSCQAHPEIYPTVDELTFEVNYEYFFPTSFNIVSARPNDSASGIRFESKGKPIWSQAEGLGLLIAHDVVFADNADTFLSLTLVVKDSDGREIRRLPGIKVGYRRGFLTTVYGNFLTAGQEDGGVEISTDWADDIVVRF